MLFLPFICISAGMVLFQTKWMWTKPHVLLGVILLTFGFLGVGHTGTIGQNTFENLATLVTSYGAMVIFFGFMISGVFIMLQLSAGEVLEFFAKLMPKPQYKPAMAETTSQENNGGFNMTKLSLFGKKNGSFSVNDPNQKGKNGQPIAADG